jgi:hypothetical protein
MSWLKRVRASRHVAASDGLIDDRLALVFIVLARALLPFCWALLPSIAAALPLINKIKLILPIMKH